jgi:hypothetical protein
VVAGLDVVRSQLMPDLRAGRRSRGRLPSRSSSLCATSSLSPPRCWQAAPLATLPVSIRWPRGSTRFAPTRSPSHGRTRSIVRLPATSSTRSSRRRRRHVVSAPRFPVTAPPRSWAEKEAAMPSSDASCAPSRPRTRTISARWS